MFARLGTWERVQGVQGALAAKARVADGRDPNPSLLSIDSQTVKAAETADETGFDPGKKTKGRKRHALVDSLGLVFAVAVTAASVSDADGAELVLQMAAATNPRLAAVLARAYASKSLGFSRISTFCRRSEDGFSRETRFQLPALLELHRVFQRILTRKPCRPGRFGVPPGHVGRRHDGGGSAIPTGHRVRVAGPDDVRAAAEAVAGGALLLVATSQPVVGQGVRGSGHDLAK